MLTDEKKEELVRIPIVNEVRDILWNEKLIDLVLVLFVKFCDRNEILSSFVVYKFLFEDTSLTKAKLSRLAFLLAHLRHKKKCTETLILLDPN